MINPMASFLGRAAVTGLALWVVTLIVPGISFVGGDTTVQKIGIVFVVADIVVQFTTCERARANYDVSFADSARLDFLFLGF